MHPRVVRLVHRVLLLLSPTPLNPLSLGLRLTATPHCAFHLSLVMVARFRLSGSSHTIFVAWKIPLSSFHPSTCFPDSCQVLPSSLEPIPNGLLAFPARERAAGRCSRPQAAGTAPSLQCPHYWHHYHRLLPARILMRVLCPLSLLFSCVTASTTL